MTFMRAARMSNTGCTGWSAGSDAASPRLKSSRPGGCPSLADRVRALKFAATGRVLCASCQHAKGNVPGWKQNPACARCRRTRELIRQTLDWMKEHGHV